MREAVIVRQILKYLNSFPDADFEKSPPGSLTGKPDITGTAPMVHGRYIGIEVKQPGKWPTAAQEYKLQKLRDAGAYCFVAHSVDEVRNQIVALIEGIRA
jgi:hypothetical protein